MYLRRITDDEYNSLEIHRKNIRKCISNTLRFKQNKCGLDYVKDDMYLQSDSSNHIYIITNHKQIGSPLKYSIICNWMNEYTYWPKFVDDYNSLINREQLARKLSVFLNNELLVLDITKYIIDIAILEKAS